MSQLPFDPASPLARRLRWVGIAFIVLGVAAILVPEVATLAVELFVAWGFLFWGVLGAMLAFAIRHERGAWQMGLLFGLVALLGLILLLRPWAGILTLTMLLIALLILEGVFSIAVGLSVRERARGWGWLVASGAVSLAVAALVISGWPGSATWLLGLLAGINFLSTGISAVILSRGPLA